MTPPLCQQAGNELRSQLTAYDGTPSEAKALSKPRHLSIDDPISSLAQDGLALSPLSAEQSSNDDYSCCSSSVSETIVTAHSRSNEGESKCDVNDANNASQANTAAEAHYLGSGSTTNASWIGGLSMQPLIVPQSLQKAQAKSWDQILDMLYIIPADAHFAIRQTIIEALAAAEAAKGGHAVPLVVSRCLHIAISTHDPVRMRLIGLRTLEKCRPKQDDLLDKLCSFLASQQPSPAVIAPSVVPVVPVRQPATTRLPIGYGVSAVRGDANFREAVAKKSSRPWHELIEEIRTLKPNNGYPFRVNITAAIKSATAHQVPRSAEVARRLAHSLSLYSRKSCGATKQEALKVLELAPDA